MNIHILRQDLEQYIKDHKKEKNYIIRKCEKCDGFIAMHIDIPVGYYDFKKR